jgi:sporulation protein YlmC with PRC-barrel domain
MIAFGLMQVLLGKEVTTSDGAGVGLAADLKLDLEHNKIWVIVEKQGTWSTFPSEQIAILPGKAILFEGRIAS